jgi:2-polyprenyl-3-methyl-5-hydroxy-6-metoxy-1,4-benzoquinol methylase
MLAKIYRLINNILEATHIFKIRKIRTFFWDLRARDINKRWGNANGDFDIIRSVIKTANAHTLLDFGCGNGRLFTLYNELKIEKVVGQDISAAAIKLAQQKTGGRNYTLLCADIADVTFDEKYFDLVISNRSLSAVHPNDISAVMRKLCNLSKYVYINELSDIEKDGESSYWFKHNYNQMMAQNNFKALDNGIIEGTLQEWTLYKQL